MSSKPCILIMGVSGSGKTTVATRLGKRLSLPCLEADDFHPPENIRKMRDGQPLEDADRLPWLQKLNALLREKEGEGCVLACSALKEKYRARLRSGLKMPLIVVFLDGTFGQISERMKARKRHFMPEELLRSQFDDLEVPENGLRIPIDQNPEKIVDRIITGIEAKS